MRESFQELLTDLEPKLLQLLSMPAVKACELPSKMPTAGLYVFSSGDEHLYVGRTNRLRSRIQEHCRKSSSSDSAPFAFKLARIRTGFTARSYRKQGSRRRLTDQAEFGQAFLDAKSELRTLDVRWVEEDRPKQQFLLELYVALALETQHNDFDNH